MPYPRAHLYLLILVPLVGLAFWPGYFARLGETPWAIHLHGITAMLWVLMLISQGWAIHSGRRGLHRATGRSSFLLVPVFFAGGFLVLQTMSQRTFGGHAFYEVFGAGLGALDLLAVLFFAGFYYAALRNRRQVQLHARYMLATVLLLATPIASRVLNGYVPGLRIEGPEDMHLFVVSVHLGNAIGLAIALGLYLQARRYGLPWLLAASFLVASSISFQWFAATGPWQTVFRGIGLLPSFVLVALGLLLGALVLWRGLRPAPPDAGPGPGAECSDPDLIPRLKKQTEVSIF
jgi:hypothetical protein